MLTVVRSHRRRCPLQHILIAGQLADLDEISLALALLPPDTYGQVLVEAPAGSLVPLIAPPRVSIQRIDPATGSLAGAVAAWAAEWVPDEPDPRRTVSAWLGSHARQSIDLAYLGLDAS